MRRLTIALGVLTGVFGAALIGPQFASAVDATWDGSADAIWANLDNWVGPPASVPGTNNTATFNDVGGADDTIDLGYGVIVKSILFDSVNAAAYTIGSIGIDAQTLTLNDAGAVTMNATVVKDELFNAQVLLGTTTFTNNSLTKSLSFAGSINGAYSGAKTLTVTGAGNTAISGAIGTGMATSIALTKTGAGTLTLSGMNGYAGATTVNGGTLLLDMTGSGSINSTSPLTLGGGTFSVKGAATSGTYQTMGILTLTANTANKIVLNSNGGDGTILTLGGAWVRSYGASMMFDYSSGNGTSFVKTASGVTTAGGEPQGGQMQAGFTGTNKIFGYALVKDSGGVGFAKQDASFNIVRYDDTAGTILAANSNASTTDFTTLNTVYTGGTFSWTGVANRSVNSLTIDTTNSGGTIDMGAATNVLTLTGGGILFKGSNNATLTGGKLGGGNSGWGNAEVIIHQTGTGTLTLNTPYGWTNASSNLSYAHPGSLVKDGDGVLVLAGASTYGLWGGYGGPSTTVNAGTLRAGVATVAGVSGAFGVNVPMVLANVAGASLDLAGYDNTIDSLAGGGTLGGNVTLGAAALTVGGRNGSGVYAGVISSSGTPATSLIKVGTGTETFAGANIYTGATVVNKGTLLLGGTAGALTATTAVTVNGGGTLTVGDTTTAANNNGVNNRINTAATLTLGGGAGGGTLTVAAPATGSVSQSLPSLTVNPGANTIQGTVATATLTLTGPAGSVYTRNAGGIVNFATAMTSFTNAPTANTSKGTTGDTILVGALLNNADFVKAGAGTVAAAACDTQNDASLWGTAGFDGNITGAAISGTTTGGTASINALKNTGGGTVVIGGVDTDVLSIKSGMILSTSTPTIDGPGKLTSGNGQDLAIYNSNTFTINAPIAVAGALTKAGGGTLSLTSATSSIGGAIYHQAGTLNFNPTGTASYASAITGLGSITKSGANTLNLTGPVSIAGTFTVNADGGTVSLADTATVGGALTVNSGGSASFAGATSFANTVTVNAGGTLQWSSAYNAPTTKTSTITVGSSGSARATATITVPAGVRLDTGAISVGKDSTGNGGSPAGHELTINVGSGGTMDLNTGYIYIGGNGATGGGVGTLNVNGADDTALIISGYQAHFDPGRGPNSIGYVNLSGGKIQPVYTDWGNGGSAIGYQTGGIMAGGPRGLGSSGTGTSSYTVAGGSMQPGGPVGVATGANATLTVVSGGTYLGGHISLGGTNSSAIGTLNVAGGLVSVSVDGNNYPTNGVSLGNNIAAQGVLNIAGGTLALDGGISAPVAGSVGTINLSGGTIQYLVNAANINYSAQYNPYNPTKTWMGGFTHAYVYPGGVTIDTGNFTGAFSQALEAATETGVTGITLDGQGEGYTAAPLVSFTGGEVAPGGSEAQAVATFDRATGKVTGITIVNPGQYTTPPTEVVLSKPGTGTLALDTWTTAATASIASTGSNSGGGLTKLGTGTLTLSNANTYNGVTLVSAGTLALGNFDALQKSTLDTGISGSQQVTFTAGVGVYNLGGLQGSDALAIGLNALNVGANNASTTYSGALSSTGGGLTKVGNGTLILSGTNTYGGTTISAGALQFANLLSMPSVDPVAVETGATLAVNVGGSGEWTTGTSGAGTLGGLLSGTGGQGNSVTYSGNVTLGIDTTSGNQIYDGAIGDVGTTLGLTKLGTNKLTLTGATTYTGDTKVMAGALETGTISGPTSNTIVAAGASLTATSIVQNTLTIGAGGSVTIRETTGAGSASPVPEPGTWILIGTALVGLLALRRRR